MKYFLNILYPKLLPKKCYFLFNNEFTNREPRRSHKYNLIRK